MSLLCLAHHSVRLWCSPVRWPRRAVNPVQIRWNSSRFPPSFWGKMAVFDKTEPLSSPHPSNPIFLRHFLGYRTKRLRHARIKSRCAETGKQGVLVGFHETRRHIHDIYIHIIHFFRAFFNVTRHNVCARVPWSIDSCTVMHSHACNDFFICVEWPIFTSEFSYRHVCFLPTRLSWWRLKNKMGMLLWVRVVHGDSPSYPMVQCHQHGTSAQRVFRIVPCFVLLKWYN